MAPLRTQQRDRVRRQQVGRPGRLRRSCPVNTSVQSPSSDSVVSRQPPSRASPTGSRVPTVTTPPRSKASTCSAAAPVGEHRPVAGEQLRPVPAQPQRPGW